VVIPTSRGGADLETCLVSLVDQDYPEVEVVVVDNASPDRSIARLPERFPTVSVLHNEENLGFVGASNQGIEASSGELILLLNDDTALEPGALSALVDTLARNPAWGACQAKLLLMDDPSRLDTAGSFLTATGFLIHRGAFEPEDRFTASDEIFAAKGAALLVRRRALEDQHARAMFARGERGAQRGVAAAHHDHVVSITHLFPFNRRGPRLLAKLVARRGGAGDPPEDGARHEPGAARVFDRRRSGL
jgi:glycosyltransferase involved in cell wall biosynthesis